MEQITIQQGEKRNKLGQFIVGTIPRHKGIGLPQISRENNYRWKGGSHSTARRIAKDYGMDLTKCQICSFLEEETKGRTVLHHIDGNEFNNKRKNLCILCDFCHNAIHDNLNKKSTRFQKGHKVSKEIRMKIGKANTKHGRYTGGNL